MLILLPLVLILLAYSFDKEIRLNSIILYVLAIVLSSLTFLFPNKILFHFIANGQIGLAFLITVMFTGAIPRGSKLKSQLRKVRREFAILAFIFATPHALLNIYNLFLGIGYFEIFGLLTLIFMVPLVISSFSNIKRNMKTSSWIRLHRLAYLVFGLLFVHLVTVSNIKDILLYCVLFGIYLFLKLYNYHLKKHRLFYSTIITIAFIGSCAYASLDDIEYNYDYINYLETGEFDNGTYYGVSKGYRNNSTSVYVSIKDNVIVNITLDECGCTPYTDNGFYLDSAYVITNRISYSNRTDVDSVSGATATSISVNEAVINALKKAKK